MQLTPKRTRFIEEYLVDLNPRAAAQRAGYAAAVGYNLLYTPEVAEAVAEAQAERARRTHIGVDRVVRELAAIAFSDIRNAVSWSEHAPEPSAEHDAPGDECSDARAKYRVKVKDSAQIDEGTAAAIAEVRRYSWGAVRLKMHDKLAALALLGRHLGMFVDRHEVVSKDADAFEMAPMVGRLAKLTTEQRNQLRAAIRAAVEVRTP